MTWETDRITKVTVRFENPDGSEVFIRTYHMVPDASFIKCSNPQGKIQGYLKLKGPVTKYVDHHEKTKD